MEKVRLRIMALMATLMLVCGILAPFACDTIPGTTPPSGQPAPGASDAKPIQSGQSVSSAIDPPSFTERWTFTGEAGQRVLIRLARTSGLFVPILSLFAPAAESPVASAPTDESATTEEGSLLSGERLIDHQLVGSGQYTIVVEDSGLDETGAYDLTFLQMGDTLTSPEDPDGGPIASAQPQAGQFNVVGDMDAFTFAGAAGQQVLIRALVPSELFGEFPYLSRNMEFGAQPEFAFRIYPPGGGPMLAYSEITYPSSSMPTGEVTTALPNHFQLPADGQYTYVLSGPRSDQPAYGITATGGYRLLLLNLGDTVTSPEDPDGGPISSGETRQARFDDGLDIDVFKFAGTAGQRVLIRTDPELTFELVSPNRPVWALSDNQLDETGEWKLVVPTQILGGSPIPSDYYPADYSITFLNLDDTLTSPGDPDGGSIGFGETRSGTLSDWSDMDAFTFTGAAGQRVRIDFGEGPRGIAYLYPPGSGERLSTDVLPTAGEYTIVVVPSQYDALPHSYQLTLEQL